MEEFVRRHTVQCVGIVLHALGVDIDRSTVGVLHPTAAGTSREVIEKEVSLERPVIHPAGRGGHDFLQVRHDPLHVVVCRVGVHDHAIVTAAFVEVRFLERSDLHRRIDQAVIVLGSERISLGRERRCEFPSGRNIHEAHASLCVARVGQVHQNFGEVKKRVARAEMRAIGPRSAAVISYSTVAPS